MIGKITEKELSSNFKEKINSLESELSTQLPKHLSLKHGVNIVESETNSLINTPYIKGRTVVNHAPLFDSGLWSFHTNLTVNSPTKATFESISSGFTTAASLRILVKPSTTYALKGILDRIRETAEGSGIYLSIEEYEVKGSETRTTLTNMLSGEGFFTSRSNTVEINLRVMVNSEGTFTFENICLVEGNEPKEFVRGFQPIRNPVFVGYGKNLINIPPLFPTSNATTKYISLSSVELEWVSGFDCRSSIINVLPNTEYTLSFNYVPTIVDSDTQSDIRVMISGSNPAILLTNGAGKYTLRINTLTQDSIYFNITRPPSGSSPYGRAIISNVQLELGSQTTEFEPQKRLHMYFPEVTLASSADGTVYDELLPNREVVKRFDHAVIDGDFEGFVNVSALQNDGVKAIRFNEWASRNNALINNVDGDPSAYLAKYNGLLSAWGSSSLADHFNIGVGSGVNQNNLYIGVSNQDSGWGDNYTPTADEIKAYFNGWKMYVNSGVRQDGYNGTGEKAWYPVTLAFSSVPYDANLRRAVCPVSEIAPQPNWQPYKLQYQLAEPRIEKTNHIGRVQLKEGVNYIEVSEGIVLREKVTPMGNLTYLYIADTNQPLALFKNKPLKILRIYKNKTDDTHNWYLYNSGVNMQGEEKARLDYVNFDPTATYYVDYVMMSEYTGQVKETLASYPVSIASKVDQHAVFVCNLEERMGTSEKRIEEVRNELFTSVDNGKRDLRTSIIGKGGNVEGTHPNSFEELTAGVNSILIGGVESVQQIRREFSGSATTSIDVNIAPVDLNRSVIIFNFASMYYSFISPGNHLYRSEFANSSVVRFSRGDNSGASPPSGEIDAFIVQFRNIKSLQRGTFTGNIADGYQVTVTPINMNKSLLFYSYSSTGGMLTNFITGGWFRSHNTIEFRNRGQGSIADVIVNWQVVEFE